MKQFILFGLLLVLVGCTDDSSLRVRNSLTKAVILNAEWGGVPLASHLMPGETSQKIHISKNDYYYDIDLPEKHTLKFVIDVNGDQVYLQTQESFELGKEHNLLINVTDSTEVTNLLLNE